MKPDIGDWIVYTATAKQVLRLAQIKHVGPKFIVLEGNDRTTFRSVLACVLSRGEGAMLHQSLEALEREYEKTVNELPGIFARRRADLVAKFNGETK